MIMRTAQKREPKVTREKAEAAANFMKSLANPNRLMIACYSVATAYLMRYCFTATQYRSR